ncbi:3-dehydroquinate dehydratase-2 [Desulfitispora alkaliphila]|uniref:type II 3-dehydroquinate dehydratase n=1 Tax=Desulfitispora alkaliphila TaxID=622674 RepID=UPI003D25BCDC
MKILVINGPNINLLGIREPDIYGKLTYETMNEKISQEAKKIGAEVDFIQSNHEGEIIDALHSAMEKYEGIVINPAAYTHYSLAIMDAIKAIEVPAVEVHLSNISTREEYRRKSVTAEACVGQISGMGYFGYVLGIMALQHKGKG